MKALSIALTLLILGLPAGAQLKGHVETTGGDLKYQTPTLDEETYLDWTGWHQRFLLEVRRRLLVKASRGFPISGRIAIVLKVSKEGKILQEILKDDSGNLGLLIPNILDDLQNSEFTNFPKGSRREQVRLELSLSVGSQDFLQVEPDYEIMKK